MKSKFTIFRGTNTVDANGIQHVSTFRRILPQVRLNKTISESQKMHKILFTFWSLFAQIFGAMAKSLMIINIGEFLGFSALVIPSLTGLSQDLNPDEMVQITASQASWLCKFCIFFLVFSILNFSLFSLQQHFRIWPTQR